MNRLGRSLGSAYNPGNLSVPGSETLSARILSPLSPTRSRPCKDVEDEHTPPTAFESQKSCLGAPSRTHEGTEKNAPEPRSRPWYDRDWPSSGMASIAVDSPQMQMLLGRFKHHLMPGNRAIYNFFFFRNRWRRCGLPLQRWLVQRRCCPTWTDGWRSP